MSSTTGPIQIKRVAVIGAGTMGAQIATLTAFSGRPVRIFDAIPTAMANARTRIDEQIAPEIERAAILPSGRDEALGRLSFASSLEEAVDGADLVIEAVREDVDVKRGLFAELDRLAPTAILSTNSSSLPSSTLVSAVTKPTRVLNTHFFAPIWVRTMLEVMSSGETDPEIIAAVVRFGRSLGLATAAVHGQSKGFIINRIWRAVKRESLHVVDDGIATPEDIDRLWMIFFQTKYAPFGIMDMVGLDVVRDIEWSYQKETLDPTDVPSATLKRMIAAGELGEKIGKGFYSHPNPAYLDDDFLLGGAVAKDGSND
jgi:3-hydroxybutyryl-CoA dehydrogenase